MWRFLPTHARCVAFELNSSSAARRYYEEIKMSRHEIENLYSLAVGVETGFNGDSLLRFKIVPCKF
jgi:hypothetical protein